MDILQQAMEKTWIEVALNCAHAGDRQPAMPRAARQLIAEGIACAKAGAAIVQVQAFDDSGRPSDDVELYARIIEGIREVADVIVYPAAEANAGAAQRLAPVAQLAERGLLEWLPVQPGSVNLSHYDAVRADRPGALLCNAEQDVRAALQLARRYGLHPSYAIFEPGFIRLGAALHWRESSPPPVYRFMFSRGYALSFPPEDYGLTAYLKLLDQAAPGARWMAGGLDVDLMPMIPRILVEGGQVRVGLGDAPYGCDSGNLQLVEAAAAVLTKSGGELAQAREVRMAIAPERYENV